MWEPACCSAVLNTKDSMVGETITWHQKILTQIVFLVLSNCLTLGKSLPL